MKKKKYDTSVVMLYLIGKEHLLPKEFRKQIPYSTIASWRRIDYSSYIGQEFRIFFEDRTDYLLLQKTYNEQQRALRSIAKAWLTLRNDVSSIIQKAKTDVLFQKRIVHSIDYLKTALGLRKTLKILWIDQQALSGMVYNCKGLLYCLLFLSLCEEISASTSEKGGTTDEKTTNHTPAFPLANSINCC